MPASQTPAPPADADLVIEGIKVGTTTRTELQARFGKWGSTNIINGVGLELLNYPALHMRVSTVAGEPIIWNVYLHPGAAFKTHRGVGIGTPEAEVLKGPEPSNAWQPSGTLTPSSSRPNRTAMAASRP